MHRSRLNLLALFMTMFMMGCRTWGPLTSEGLLSFAPGKADTEANDIGEEIELIRDNPLSNDKTSAEQLAEVMQQSADASAAAQAEYERRRTEQLQKILSAPKEAPTSEANSPQPSGGSSKVNVSKTVTDAVPTIQKPDREMLLESLQFIDSPEVRARVLELIVDGEEDEVPTKSSLRLPPLNPELDSSKPEQGSSAQNHTLGPNDARMSQPRGSNSLRNEYSPPERLPSNSQFPIGTGVTEPHLEALSRQLAMPLSGMGLGGTGLGGTGLGGTGLGGTGLGSGFSDPSISSQMAILEQMTQDAMINNSPYAQFPSGASSWNTNASWNASESDLQNGQNQKAAYRSGIAPRDLPPIGAWKQHIQETIKALEANRYRSIDELSEAERNRHEVALRFLYLLIDDRDRALATIDGLETSEQEFMKELMFALSERFADTTINLDSPLFASSPRQKAISNHHLREALGHSSDSATLQIRNLAFCRSIQGFGAYETFTNSSFAAGDEVLLYCELENLSARSRPLADYQVFESKIHGSLTIYDENREVVRQVDYQDVQDAGRNRRIDFYVHFGWQIPKLKPGKYFAHLTVEDLYGNKSAISPTPLEFQVR